MSLIAWTLKEYQERVISLASDQDIQPNDVTVWVNECLEDLQPYARLEASATIPLVAGQSAYPVPEDFYEPAMLTIQSTDGRVHEVRPLDMKDRDSEGYRLWNGQIILQRLSAEGHNEVLQLDYYRLIPSLRLLTDAPILPDIWHDLPFLYACMRAKQQDSEFGESQNYEAQYQMRKGEFTAARRRGLPGTRRHVKIVRPWL